MEAQVEIINIMWEGPLKLKKVYKKNGSSDRGVYQCYGYHPVYGLDVLLYIGKVTPQIAKVTSQDRTFGIRLSEEGFEGWNQAIQIYLGRIISITKEEHQSSDTNDEDWRRKIDQAESLLIHACFPAYNSQGIKSPPEDCKNLLILNWGQFGSLPEAISGYRTCKGSLDEGSYRFMGQ